MVIEGIHRTCIALSRSKQAKVGILVKNRIKANTIADNFLPSAYVACTL